MAPTSFFQLDGASKIRKLECKTNVDFIFKVRSLLVRCFCYIHFTIAFVSGLLCSYVDGHLSHVPEPPLEALRGHWHWHGIRRKVAYIEQHEHYCISYMCRTGLSQSQSNVSQCPLRTEADGIEEMCQRSMKYFVNGGGWPTCLSYMLVSYALLC